jgi:hypothetical protein
MPKLITALVATSTILLVASVVGRAEARTMTDVGSLAPVTESDGPDVEEVGYWRRQYRRAYRRGYYGYDYPYYSYGYRPYYGYGYAPYAYYGYGYRAYPYYGYRWRY